MGALNILGGAPIAAEYGRVEPENQKDLTARVPFLTLSVQIHSRNLTVPKFQELPLGKPESYGLQQVFSWDCVFEWRMRGKQGCHLWAREETT